VPLPSYGLLFDVANTGGTPAPPVTTLNSYYASAAAVPPPNRRWAVGAGWQLYERVQLLGFPFATAQAQILSLPQYADALSAAGLTTAFNAVNSFAANTGVTGISLPGTSGNYITTPDSVPLSITGDIDLRFQGSLNWQTSSAKLLNQWPGSWLIQMDGAGHLLFAAQPGPRIATSTATVPFANGATGWVRATFVTATGAANLYTSIDGAAWTSLFSTTLTTGPMDNGVGNITVGGQDDNTALMTGTVNRAIVMSGVNGTTQGDFDPTRVSKTGTRTPNAFQDAQGNTWTANGTGWDWT